MEIIYHKMMKTFEGLGEAHRSRPADFNTDPHDAEAIAPAWETTRKEK